jgi:predicted RNA-binding protein Jag
MAERSAQLGRFYAIASMTAENRKRVLMAAASVPGVQVRAEGEGRNRRVVFVPAKPVPMPRRAVLDYGDDDEE